LQTVTVTQRVACMTVPCVAAAVTLKPVRATVSGQTVTARWPRLRLRSRVTSADLAASSPRFAADSTPGAPSYRVAPGTAATVLEIVSTLAAAGAAALLALEALALVRRRSRATETDELARALRLVREAEDRPVPDRRRALGLLARLLHSREANDLAWAAPAPEPQAIEELVTSVERERTG
jgi:hypothetical protein